LAELDLGISWRTQKQFQETTTDIEIGIDDLEDDDDNFFTEAPAEEEAEPEPEEEPEEEDEVPAEDADPSENNQHQALIKCLKCNRSFNSIADVISHQNTAHCERKAHPDGHRRHLPQSIS